VGWLILAFLALIVLTQAWRVVGYWLWVRSIKDPQKRMEAEILYRSWRKKR
jgi:hypothetical protein